MAAAAFDRTLLVRRFSPAMSATDDMSRTSEPPASAPPAAATCVETITLGNPKGSREKARTATEVPPDPPTTIPPERSPASTSCSRMVAAPLPIAQRASARSPASARSASR